MSEVLLTAIPMDFILFFQLNRPAGLHGYVTTPNENFTLQN